MRVYVASVLTLLALTSVVLPPPAGATVMDFEDIAGHNPTSPPLYLLNYGGFAWHTWVFAVEKEYTVPDARPIINGKVGMLNGWGYDFMFKRLDESLWTFNSAQIGHVASGSAGHPIRFVGSVGSQVKYDLTLSDIPWTGQQYTFDWIDVQRVWVYTRTSSPTGNCQQVICMDDIRYNEPASDPPETTPELSSSTLLLLGALPVGLAWWRRRRA